MTKQEKQSWVFGVVGFILITFGVWSAYFVLIRGD